VFRDEYGRAVTVLVRVLGDIDLAEDAVQDACTAAVRLWPSRRAPREGLAELLPDEPEVLGLLLRARQGRTLAD
jgi:predicted RNA polymerase sigma factor